jgi:hypothetical protein
VTDSRWSYVEADVEQAPLMAIDFFEVAGFDDPRVEGCKSTAEFK